MTTTRHCTTGTVTTNKSSLQLYFDVQFSRSAKNPLRGASEYAAFCDSGVIVVFPTGECPEFPLEVDPPAEATQQFPNSERESEPDSNPEPDP